jgi:hypothetical protein
MVAKMAEQPTEELMAKVRGYLDAVHKSEATLLSARLAAGQYLLALRTRVEAGELEVNWWDWYVANIGSGRRNAEWLMKMAAAVSR